MVLLISTLDEQPADVAFFGALAGWFAQQGHGIVKWADRPLPPGTGAPSAWLPLSFYIDRTCEFFHPQPPAAFPEPSVWAERWALTRRNPARPNLSATELLPRYAALCQHVLEAAQPSLVLVSNPLTPHTGIPAAIARERGLPVLTFERGYFPHTWMLDAGGIAGHSEIAALPLAALLAEKEALLPAGSRWVAQTAPTLLSRRTAHSPEPHLQTWLQAYPGKPAILFLSRDDSSCGLFPADHPDRQLESPHFADSFAVAESLARQLPDWPILFRPHPALRQVGNWAEWEGRALKWPNLLTTFAPTEKLIAQADVVVCNGTSAEFMALLAGKPVVLAGRSFLSGKQIGWEVEDADQLGQMAAQAFAEGLTHERKERFALLCGYLEAHYFCSIQPDAPLSLARRLEEHPVIARWKQTTRPPEESERRVVKAAGRLIRQTSVQWWRFRLSKWLKRHT